MRRLAVVLSALVLFLAGCGDGEDRPGTASGSGSGSGSGTHAGSGSGSGTHAGEDEPAFADKDATSNVTVTLRDFEFVGIPATIKGPNVLFRATNSGPSDHELHIGKADDEDHALGEVEAMEQGASGKLAIELEPGAYVATCLLETGGKTHAELGMRQAFTVEG